MLILLLSTLLTVVKNPPDSLLCLIGAFILTIGLLLKIGMDFVAFSFLIVYIGAVAILFLFVIILFNLNEIFVEQGLHFVVKFGIGVSAYIIIDYIANLFYIGSLSSSIGTDLTNTIINTPSILIDMRDVYIFTTTFYSYYWDFFIICG
jgi:NADH:ubiquinone oxidoreductase subunit 6 (subunit J)